MCFILLHYNNNQVSSFIYLFMIICLHCTLIICGKCVVIVMKIFFSIHKLLVLNKDFVFFMQNMIFLFVGEF